MIRKTERQVRLDLSNPSICSLDELIDALQQTSHSAWRRRVLSELKIRLVDLKRKAYLWDQVYQDRCEGAFVEQTVRDRRIKEFIRMTNEFSKTNVSLKD